MDLWPEDEMVGARHQRDGGNRVLLYILELICHRLRLKNVSCDLDLGS